MAAYLLALSPSVFAGCLPSPPLLSLSEKSGTEIIISMSVSPMDRGVYRVTPKGFEELKGYMEAVQKDQLPFAAMLTLNDLAFATRTALIDVATRVFDRPKPATLKNFYVRKATKTNLVATIWFDQTYSEWDGKEYMLPQVEGGPRGMKNSERMISSYWVPGAGARIDPFGNIQGGQIQQILSYLQLFGEVGYTMNLNKRNEKKRRPMSRGTEYFIVRNRHGGLAPGVYQRIPKGVGPYPKGREPWFKGKTSRSLPTGAFQKGMSSGPISSVVRARGAMPVMVFTPQAPTYRKRFPFYETAQKVAAEKLQPMFSARVRQALATSGFKGGWRQWGGG